MAKKTQSRAGQARRNPVAQHAHKVNRSFAFEERNRYRRQAKHKVLEPFPISGCSNERKLGKAWVA